MRDRNGRTFVYLVEALAGSVQQDATRLQAALTAADPQRLAQTAARHKCAGLLLRGLTTSRVADPTGGRLIRPLQSYCRSVALQAFVLRSQLEAVVQAFNDAAVPFVLLKGASRLYADDVDAYSNQMFDLDLLIHEKDREAALAALKRIGYRDLANETLTAHYVASHHHLAPLQPPTTGVPVELHVALAEPNRMSLRFDWNALAPYLESIDGTAGKALRLNPVGTALHLAIHGLGLTRLHDIVLLARFMRADPQLAGTLMHLMSDEQLQRLSFEAVLALAAEVAGLERNTTKQVHRYISWALRREDLPTYLRVRTQGTDAWYLNGGSFFGPATVFALPEITIDGRWSLAKTAFWPARLVTRTALAAYAAKYAAALPSAEKTAFTDVPQSPARSYPALTQAAGLKAASVAVVIPSKNRPEDLQICLRSILKQPTQPAEIIVVDQSDTRYELPRTAHLHHIYNPNLSGTSEARNVGALSSTGDIVLFLDDDVEFVNDCLSELTTAFTIHPNAVGIECNIYPRDPFFGIRSRIWHAIFSRGFFNSTMIVRKDGIQLRNTGGFSAYYRKLFEYEQFDQHLRGYCLGEDWEFSMRARRYGKLYLAPNAFVLHRTSPVNRHSLGRYMKLRWDNHLYFYDKLEANRFGPNRFWRFWWMLGESLKWWKLGYGFPLLGSMKIDEHVGSNENR